MNMQRGFINIVIAVFIAAVIVVGGYYFIKNQNTTFNQKTTQSKNIEDNNVGNKTGVPKADNQTGSAQEKPIAPSPKPSPAQTQNSVVGPEEISVFSPAGRQQIREYEHFTIKWTPVHGDFDYYMVNFGNNLVGIYGNPVHPNPVSKTETSLTLRVDKSIVQMFLSNAAGQSPDKIRENMFVRVQAEKNLPNGKVQVVGSGKSLVFTIFSYDEARWVPTASRPALQPTETPDGILLTAEKEGDESTVFLDIKLPATANVFNFDMKFQEKGDGDWLTATFNDQLLFSFRGENYFGNDFQNIDLPIGYLAGQVGVLKFTLHGYGSTASGVFIKNIKFLNVQ